jgi:adenylate cyclase
VWRRQLAAYFARIASNASQGAVGDSSTMAVGFADLRNFTSLTRTWSESELREVLEDFESTANDIVGDHTGRIVKTIGDEVLFVADRPGDAALIALDLLDAIDSKPDLPPLRIGLAAGPVVLRFGDVYGTTVNIASRLTSLARPGSVLVDRVMAEQLGDDERFVLRPKRAESVRGYHHLHQWRLRRSDDTRSERHHRDERHEDR